MLSSFGFPASPALANNSNVQHTWRPAVVRYKNYLVALAISSYQQEAIIYFIFCGIVDVNVVRFIILIACLVIGVRRGGIGLAAVSAIGLVFFIFVMHLKPGNPPVDVMLTIMAVVTCSAFLQTLKALMLC